MCSACFEQLCQTARSQNDYIELSRIYHTVLLADVKQMDSKIDDAARRFIALVDEFYERNVKLIISWEINLRRRRANLLDLRSSRFNNQLHLL